MTTQQKKQIVYSFLQIIEVIADRDYQIRAWINGEAADFDETVCLFFDLCDPLLEKYKEFEIRNDQYLLLKRLSETFRPFAHENDFPEEFIDTPEWAKITEMAREVLKTFHDKKE